MKFKYILAAAMLGAASLAGCQPPASNNTESAETSSADAAALPCGVIAHRDWEAILNTQPGPGAARTLTVSGEIDLPTPGYSVSLARDQSDSADATEPHLLLTIAPPTGEGHLTVVTPHPVRYFAPASGAYTVVHIMCDGQALTDISVTHVQ